MAEIVTIEGQEFKQRNIWAVWIGLPLITLGIYSLVWYFKINDEARRYLRDESIRPGISVLAVTLGALVIVPAFVSIWNTANCIQRMQQNAGVERQIELLVEEGSLYPALQRLEDQGWIEAEWGTSSNNRKARFYNLTKAGRKQLTRETGQWRKLVAAIGRVLGPEV